MSVNATKSFIWCHRYFVPTRPKIYLLIIRARADVIFNITLMNNYDGDLGLERGKNMIVYREKYCALPHGRLVTGLFG